LTATNVTQQYKREREVVFQQQHFQYSSSMSLHKLFKQSGSADICVKEGKENEHTMRLHNAYISFLVCTLQEARAAVSWEISDYV
jgi:hypothetical protein